jgi:DNA repair protein RecN (Recombination protein N)
MADAHFMVSKKTDKGRTTTHIQSLDEGERIEELAKMLGGETVTDNTRKAAKELVRGEATK